MKRIAILLSILALAGCKETSEEKTEQQIEREEQQEEAVVEVIKKRECFRFGSNDDTIQMDLEIKDTMASGKLFYNFSEKDDNYGAFRGILKNDTLKANYTFTSEGKTSVRSIAFLKTGDGLIPGYGEMVERDGKMVFANESALNFDENSILKRVNCE